MIRLIRTDGVEFLLNVDMIKTIEQRPDTVIVLETGESIAVKNPLDDVLTKIQADRIGQSEENRASEYSPDSRENDAETDPDSKGDSQ